MKKSIIKNGHEYVKSHNGKYYRKSFITTLNIMQFLLATIGLIAFVVMASVPEVQNNQEFAGIFIIKGIGCIAVMFAVWAAQKKISEIV